MQKYAIIESGSKQYWVEPKMTIQVEKLSDLEVNKEICLDKVLFYNSGKELKIGTPIVKDVQVICNYLGDKKGPKVISFKYRRRKASRSKKGHRQTMSELFIKDIKETK